VTIAAEDFTVVRDLVRERSAIALEGKEYLVEARLAPIVQREGLASLADLVRVLRTRRDTRLTDDVVEAMTTHETSFFRDVHPFEALRTDVIPSVLEANGGRGVAIWSAAAATGQEAYSIALTVEEHFSHVVGISILATDLSRAALARAKAGVFSQMEVNRGLPATLLVKYFERHGREWHLKPRVCGRVTFQHLNLVHSLAAVPQMDVVFLRNALIYFEPEVKAQVLDRVARVLRPGGYLFLGGAETTFGVHGGFERVQFGRAVCYRHIREDLSCR
jgi:chemotaxis protein methyltransferase CheR